MKIEELIAANTAALLANTAALTGDCDKKSCDEPPAAKKKVAAKKTVRRKKQTPPPAPEETETETETETEPSGEVTHDTVRAEIRAARKKLRADGDSAGVAEHKKAFRGLLEDEGYADVSEVPEDELEDFLASVKAL